MGLLIIGILLNSAVVKISMLKQIRTKISCLNANIDEEIFMQQPEVFFKKLKWTRKSIRMYMEMKIMRVKLLGTGT